MCVAGISRSRRDAVSWAWTASTSRAAWNQARRQNGKGKAFPLSAALNNQKHVRKNDRREEERRSTGKFTRKAHLEAIR